MDEFRVRDKRNGNIRTVTRTAYMAMGPKVYEKLPPEPESQAVVKTGNLHRSVSAPIIKPQIVQEQAAEPEQQEKAAETEVVENAIDQPKRRGRKPGSKNQISSDSDGTEK